MTINILGNVADKQPLEFTYGDRGRPAVLYNAFTKYVDRGEDVFIQPSVIDDIKRVEIYDFNATYEGENFDVEAFYHTSRFHWGYEGDHFGLLSGSNRYSRPGYLECRSRPPESRFIGKGKWDGLTLLVGPEVYWGANPAVIFKYDFKLAKIDWTFIHSEDIGPARRGDRRDRGNADDSLARRRLLQKGIYRGYETRAWRNHGGDGENRRCVHRIDANDNIYLDEIDSEDTLGFRAKLTFSAVRHKIYVSAHHAGLVADGGSPLKDFGWRDPSGCRTPVRATRRNTRRA